jgi:hypothetical protein
MKALFTEALSGSGFAGNAGSAAIAGLPIARVV